MTSHHRIEGWPSFFAARWRRLLQIMAAIRSDLSWRLAPPGAFRQRFEHAIANMPQGICVYDADDRLQLVNERFCKIYNQPMWRLRTGMSLYEVLADSCTIGNYPGRSVDDIYGARKAFIDRREQGTFFQELGDKERGGDRLIAIYHQPLDDGGWVCTYEDITERRRTEARIEFLAQHDGLTELPNRNLFNERLAEAIAQSRSDRPCALLCLDLDGFKDINDHLGHAAGDLLLKSVAQRLLDSLGAQGTAARLGGDEFAIVLPNASADDAMSLANRITASLTETHSLPDFGSGRIGVSIGIALAPLHATGVEGLLLAADKALYATKHARLGIPQLYSRDIDNIANAAATTGRQTRKAEHKSDGRNDTASLARDLTAALGEGHVHLRYQPIYDAATGRPFAFEALARWNDPSRGLVPPDVFIAAAEENSCIDLFTEWVLHAACSEALCWSLPAKVGINVSPLSFANPLFAATVQRILSGTGLPPSRLILELTEGMPLDNPSSTRRCFQDLRDMGIELWVDDFGAGYANLSHIHALSCDVVKIDRSFLAPHDKRLEILSGMISLAHSCGLRVAVEGIETDEHHTLVQQLGCDYLQGFLFARPMPPENIETALGSSVKLPLHEDAPLMA